RDDRQHPSAPGCGGVEPAIAAALRALAPAFDGRAVSYGRWYASVPVSRPAPSLPGCCRLLPRVAVAPLDSHDRDGWGPSRVWDKSPRSLPLLPPSLRATNR